MAFGGARDEHGVARARRAPDESDMPGGAVAAGSRASRAHLLVPSPAGFPGVSAVKIVNPGDPARSSIFLRMSTTSDYLMPPLVRRKVDDVTLSLMTDSIRSLTPCP